MKRSRILKLIFVMLLASILLTACSGAPLINSWPGVNADQNNAYVSYSSHVFAVKLSDGTMAWRYPADTGKAVFYARPVLHNGQVIVGDYSNTLHSLDAATGLEKWSFTEAKDRYIGPVLSFGDLIIAPSADHYLYALNSSGQLVWKFQAKNSIWAQPVTDEKAIYTASLDHFLYAINPTDGSKIWEIDLGAAVMFSLANSEDGKTIYAGTLAAEMLAVDAANGTIRWRTKLGGNVWAEPVVKDGMIYFGDQSGNIHALSEADGAEKWKYAASVPVVAGGTLIDKTLVFPLETGGVQAIDISGTKGWNFPITNGKLYSSPVSTGDRLVVAVTQGDSLLVGLNPNGTQVWAFIPPK